MATVKIGNWGNLGVLRCLGRGLRPLSDHVSNCTITSFMIPSSKLDDVQAAREAAMENMEDDSEEEEEEEEEEKEKEEKEEEKDRNRSQESQAVDTAGNKARVVKKIILVTYMRGKIKIKIKIISSTQPKPLPQHLITLIIWFWVLCSLSVPYIAQIRLHIDGHIFSEILNHNPGTCYRLSYDIAGQHLFKVLVYRYNTILNLLGHFLTFFMDLHL